MRCACPNCQNSIPVEQALPAQVFCSGCGATFFADKAEPSPPPPPKANPAAQTSTMRPVAQAAAKTAQMAPVARASAPPPMPVVIATPAPARGGPGWLLVTLGVLGVLLVVGGAVAMFGFTSGLFHGKTEVAQVEPAPRKQKPIEKIVPPANGDSPKSKDKDRQTSPKDKKTTPKDKPPEKDVKEEEPVKVPDDKNTNPDGSPKLVVKFIETIHKTEKTVPRVLRLAATKPEYDDMGKMLEQLGKGYHHQILNENDLQELSRLQQFDVLFLTCNVSTPQNLRQNEALRKFVEDGGTLYASDLRFEALRGAFREFAHDEIPPVGDEQTLTATIVESGLREVLGDTVSLHFESKGWRPAAFKREQVTTYMEARYKPFGSSGKEDILAPLLVKFTVGKGSVIFTSFHNAKQNSEVEKKLLRYLVFTAVTSQEETKVTTTMISGGFSPQPIKRLVASDEAPSATQVYQNKKAGKLQFALGFSNAGAKLKLELVSPKGAKIAREGTATFLVEVDNADAGDWRYTVTALNVPYPNFPFTLTVGEAAPK